MRSEIGRMMAQMAANGVQLDSPSALALGEKAAREMSFASQSARSVSGARVATLSASARQSRALATSSLIAGGVGAAGAVLTDAPDLWPALADKKVFA
jgi:hypothetical protein